MKRFLAFLLLLCACPPLFGQNHIGKRTDTESLYYLCKVWGFLKYHHPAVVSGEQDWDKELFAMFDKFQTIKSDKQRNALLLEWVENQGPFVTEQGSNPASVKQVADLDWIDPQAFGAELSAQLKDVRYAARPDSCYYVSFNPYVGNPEFKNEKPYPDIAPWDDVHYRFLTLCRAWNVIEYLFPYKYLTDKPWDDVLREYIPLFISADTKKEYLKVLSAFSADICDSHASLYNSRFFILQELFGISGGEKSMPYKMEYIENKYVVTASFQDEKLIQAGDIVTAIDHLDLDSLAKAIKPYIAASNDAHYHYMICRYFLIITDKDSVPHTIIRDGKKINLNLPPLGWKDYYQKINDYSGDAVKIINGDIGYINIAAFPGSDIPATMEKMSEVKGLILDLREYPKEFVIHELGAYLVGKETPFVRFSSTDLNHLGTFDDNMILKLFANKPNSFKNKIILLVNSGTMSQGEFTAMAWRTAPNAMVLGSQTAGADGNVSNLGLPGNFHLMFTGLGVYYPDGGETQRVGIRIDEEIHPTIRGTRESRDELLERAIEIINNGI